MMLSVIRVWWNVVIWSVSLQSIIVSRALLNFFTWFLFYMLFHCFLFFCSIPIVSFWTLASWVACEDFPGWILVQEWDDKFVIGGWVLEFSREFPANLNPQYTWSFSRWSKTHATKSITMLQSIGQNTPSRERKTKGMKDTQNLFSKIFDNLFVRSLIHWVINSLILFN